MMDEAIRGFHSELNSLAERSWIAAIVQVLISASSIFFQHISFHAFALSVFVTTLVYFSIFRPANHFQDYRFPDYEKFSRNFRQSSRQKYSLKPNNETIQKADIPPFYPNGWFALLESSDVHKNQVKYVAALGENFAVFRNPSGKINIVDAYCPHLGANMGIGGVVKNDCLECPFHGWRFDGETGKCTVIPYADKERSVNRMHVKPVPEFAKVRVWRSCEVNHFIFVWYHAEKEEPTYEPQPIKEITNGDYRFLGRSEYLLNAHIQDCAENSADINHHNHVHGSVPLTQKGLRNFGRNFLSSFAEINFKPTWRPHSDLPHEGVIDVASDFHIFGKPRFPLCKITGKSVGPSIFELDVSTTFFGSIKVVYCFLPIKPLEQRLVQRVYGPLLATFFGRFYSFGESLVLGQDIMLWRSKRYEANPKLVTEDKLLLDYRRCYSQFYSKNSPRFKLQDDSIEW